MGLALAQGKLTSRQLVSDHLRRIERYDGLLGSIRGVIPDALEQADASDRHRQVHGARSPLEGVPIVVKDNIDVRGIPTTAGALALADSVPVRDAHLVGRLRSAGAVILAKANLSELANFLTDNMPSGYSSLGGQVLNPYDLALTPSGSSSGSAVAVAMEMAAVGVGTETDGSIISPSVHQSLVGMKPTLGLVSRQGIVPIAPSQDTAGPMARTVTDAWILLAAMAGADPTDEASSGAEEVALALRTADPGTASLGGARLATVELLSVAESGSARRRTVGAEVVGALQGAGVSISQAEMTSHGQEDELFVLHYEFAPAMDSYLSELGETAPIRTLAHLRDWNRSHAARALKFGQTHVDQALQIDHREARDRYQETRQRDQQSAARALDDAIGDADALVFRGDEGATWAARAGWPSISIPIGYSPRSRRPLGLTLVSRAWSDVQLLSLAAGVEASCGLRSPPGDINPAVFAGRGPIT
jgi:amidase